MPSRVFVRHGFSDWGWLTYASKRMRPLASLSLDLDDRWSSLGTHGDPSWRSHPSALDLVVQRIVELFARRCRRISVFVVGEDAVRAQNREAFERLGESDHEIGNHSYRREPRLPFYGPDEVERELGAAEEAIARATGKRPKGFRGPGHGFSRAMLEVLVRRGYEYDASTLPTFLGPLARAYDPRAAGSTPAEREERRELFGGLADGLLPLRPYLWKLGDAEIVEVPVTTMPITRLPIDLSCVLHIDLALPALSLPYFRFALAMCRLRGIEPSIVLHPLDLVGREDGVGLDFLMPMRLSRKLQVIERALDLLEKRFEIVTLAEHARAARRRGGLAVRVPPAAAG